jgi:hypothetical protein
VAGWSAVARRGATIDDHRQPRRALEHARKTCSPGCPSCGPARGDPARSSHTADRRSFQTAQAGLGPMTLRAGRARWTAARCSQVQALRRTDRTSGRSKLIRTGQLPVSAVLSPPGHSRLGRACCLCTSTPRTRAGGTSRSRSTSRERRLHRTVAAAPTVSGATLPVVAIERPKDAEQVLTRSEYEIVGYALDRNAAPNYCPSDRSGNTIVGGADPITSIGVLRDLPEAQ